MMQTHADAFFDRIKMQSHPAARAGSTVVCGQARLTVLTPRLIRLEWADDGRFEDRATFAFPSRDAETPAFSHRVDADGLMVETAFLRLRYTEDGQPFHGGNLSISVEVQGKTVEWQPGLVNLGNLRGTQRTLDQVAGATALEEGLVSRDGWSLFDDSGSVVWDAEQIWVEARPDEHRQDWYFFGYGHDYKAALREYLHFGGAIPLVPRYVLGNWWSRFWAYSADDLKQLVGDFQAHDIPLDVLVVDMDWHTPDGWTGYSWNRNLFPDPEAFLAWVHSQNLYATLNLHPAEGVLRHEDAYPEFARRLGQDPADGLPIPFRGADKAFIQGYFELLHHPMENQGVDFWWIDWQQGNSTEVKNLDPLPWLNHLHFHDATRRGTRPMLYSRWGGLGNHRYPIGFSGDTYSTWSSLAFLPYFTATAANVGYGWWSHDIGGHFGAAEPELYARWVQFGAVSPCLRLHSTKDPLAERRPWGFPDPVYEAAKAAMQFRYQLLPYLYSAARQASERGLSLSYPMYYDYPDSEDAYLARGQYFLGDQLIAAPIVSPADPATGLATIDVWVPDGQWFEFTTLESFTGPRWVRLHGDLNRIPMLIKAGGIVPMASGLMQTKAFDGSHIILTLFPGADGRFELYEDDGTTTAYQQGEYEMTLVTLKVPTPEAVSITIAAAQGLCPILPARRTFELKLRAVGQPESVSVNGADAHDWTYDAETGDLWLTLKDISRREAQYVRVQVVGRERVTQVETEPFLTCMDYTLFDDARQKLGTLVIVPPAADVAFDADVEWRLHRNGTVVATIPVTLQGVLGRQIVDCPFSDDGSCTTFCWSVSASVAWRGHVTRYDHNSQAAYPSLSRWQTLIYNPLQTPLALADLLSADNTPNPALDWQTAQQTVESTVNIVQPYGVILLEQERQRMTGGEPLEACLTATFVSEHTQAAILYLQAVGAVRVILNGIELTAVDPVTHVQLQPMFYSWMPTQRHYYAVSLPSGSSRLVVFTQPDRSSGWWGVGATLLDSSGSVLA